MREKNSLLTINQEIRPKSLLVIIMSTCMQIIQKYVIGPRFVRRSLRRRTISTGTTSGEGITTLDWTHQLSCNSFTVTL